MNNRGAWFTAVLLLLLSVLMTGHLVLLGTGVRQCDAYEKILLQRLNVSKLGSPEAVLIRKELQEYLSGRTTECAAAEEDYASAADKYIAVILALLGVGAYAISSRP